MGGIVAPRKYPDELRERATRMAIDARQDPATRAGAFRRIGEQLGVHPEALRTWVKKAEIDEALGSAEGSIESKTAWLWKGRVERMVIVPRIYSDGFKCDAVALVNSGLSHKQVCKDLGVSKFALRMWVKDDRFRALGFTLTTDVGECREMTAAMQRIGELEVENEVLRRAAAYLS